MQPNPYVSPQHAPHAKLSPSDACDIKVRDPAIVALLMFVTCGIYAIYLQYQWAREINGLLGEPKYPPVVVLVLNIVTGGLAGLAFECIWAYDVARLAQDRGLPNRWAAIPIWIIGLNCAGILFALTLIGVVIGFPLGVAASFLVQAELNKLATALPVMKPGGNVPGSAHAPLL